MSHPSFGAALLLALAAPLAAQLTYDTVSYHGVSHASHQTSVNNLAPQGYRLISLAVAGGWASSHYSAVWLRQAGPVWVTSHGLTLAQYNAQRTTWENAGYRPKIVTASGSGTDKVFAAVYVQDGVAAAHATEQGLSTFRADVEAKLDAGLRLVSCATYGSTSVPLFAPVYEPDSSGIAWGYTANETVSAFANSFHEHGQGGERPTWFSMTDGMRYLSVWRDDRVGNWMAVSDRSSLQFAIDRNNMANLGLVPLCIAAGGSGSNARFSGVFVERLTPHARTLTRTGLAVTAMQPFDDYMTNTFLPQKQARAAAIAVTKNGRLVYARGYTFAEPGYPVTQPTSLFRVGSISKPITGILAHDCIEHGLGGLTLDSVMVNTLGITNHGTGVQNVRLRHLLTHTSGLAQNFTELQVAQWANPSNPQMPPDESQIVRYAALPLPNGFGSYDYSNVGLTAVGQMVEQVTGQTWLQALQNRVAAPLGVTRLHRMLPLRSQLQPTEVQYHLNRLYLRAGNLDVAQTPMAPQYCQRFWDSAGGVVTSAVDLARLFAGTYQIGSDSPVLGAAQQAVALDRQTFGSANRTPGGFAWGSDASGYYYQHDGAQDGFSALAILRDDGVGIFVCCNDDTNVSSSSLRLRADQVTSWPTNDQFPSHGLPSFPRTPRFVGFHTSSLPNVTKQAYTFSGENLDQVTSVLFGAQMLPVALSTAWENGYVELVGPTQLRVHPPQGLDPGSYAVRAFSAQGGGNVVNVTVALAPDFVCAVQDWVLGGGMPFSVFAGQGQLSNLSWVALALSQSNLPSVAPGVVSLGLGAGFTDYLATDLQPFTPIARTARWDIPGLAGYGDTWFQCVAFDLLAPNPFPLATSGVVMLDRQ